MNQLRMYNKLLLDKRGWISKLPENKKAVILVSGGYDSMITAARLVKDYEIELFLFILIADHAIVTEN